MPNVIGPITRLQIQRAPLKVGEKPNRRYVPDAVAVVESVLLTSLGVTASVDGQSTLDVHHRAHPADKNEDGRNGISFGFTSHYREMQQRFGTHMQLGCAAENILIDSARRFSLDDLGGSLVLLDGSGREKGRLTHVVVATPCRPFAGFAHKHETVEPAVLKESLAFLDGGTRGFYCALDPESGPVTLTCGDLVATA